MYRTRPKHPVYVRKYTGGMNRTAHKTIRHFMMDTIGVVDKITANFKQIDENFKNVAKHLKAETTDPMNKQDIQELFEEMFKEDDS